MNDVAPVFNIGSRKGRWRERPYCAWVTKSDVLQYLRCPYKVYLSHSEGISYDEFLDPSFRRYVLERGIELEEEAVAPIAEHVVSPVNVASFKAAASEDTAIRPSSLIRNHDLGIMGIPDLVQPEQGRLIPIEVKSHTNVLPSDRIELAFYWRLLEPLRKGKPLPTGLVWLKTGVAERVSLTEEDFEELKSIIGAVRKTKEEGTRPSIVMECQVCRFKKEHATLVVKDGGLSLLHDISFTREQQLGKLGVSNVTDLAKSNLDLLYRNWKARFRGSPGTRQLLAMQAHAKAWLTLIPQRLDPNSLPSERKGLILDLEYDQDICIFLVGILVIKDGKIIKLQQDFAEDATKEQLILRRLCQILEEFPQYPVITWNGKAADLIQLRKAWPRSRLPFRKLDVLQSRHLDLLVAARDSFRFPLKGFRLSDLAAYLGYRRRRNDVSGFLMPFLYHDYLTAQSKAAREKLRNQILDHNKFDLESCFFVWQQLLTLSKQSH